MSSTCRIHLSPDASALSQRAADILTRHLLERSGVRAERSEAAAADVLLEIRPGIGDEGFVIEDRGAQLAIAGNDDRGLLYGVGRFLHTCRFSSGRFTPSAWRGTSVPQRRVRAVYFASHFHNFYHDAPLDEIERYVEDLALWGCNTLCVWFDMHHFQGIDDPDARRMIARLRQLLMAANKVGIRGAMTTLANEAYANSPPALRADWTAGHDGYRHPPMGHYHVEICPSKPGGLEQILRDRRAVLQQFADLDIGSVVIWPYDQGGCTCSQCAPWGGNGFIRTARACAELIREILPRAKVIVSTWYFDRFINDEWPAFDRAIGREKPDWIDALLVDDCDEVFPQYPLRHPIGGGLPMVNFPEISMFRSCPWGGFGANPLPNHLQSLWSQTEGRLDGGFLYSEGIFEDLNKVICLRLYWGDMPALQTVRDYAAAYFDAAVADAVVAAAQAMERRAAHGTHGIECDSQELAAVLFPAEGPVSCRLYQTDGLEGSEQTAEQVRRIDEQLSDGVRRSWRWRIFFLRAQIDAAIVQSAGRPNAALDAMFEELAGLFHARQAEWTVCPPSRSAIMRFLGKKDDAHI